MVLGIRTVKMPSRRFGHDAQKPLSPSDPSFTAISATSATEGVRITIFIKAKHVPNHEWPAHTGGNEVLNVSSKRFRHRAVADPEHSHATKVLNTILKDPDIPLFSMPQMARQHDRAAQCEISIWVFYMFITM